MRVCFWTIIACVAAHGLAAQVADERNRDDVTAHWRAITAIDLEAAYRLIHDNHPGAAREVRDTGFQGRLEAAHSAALERTTHVTDVNGYLATLSGFGVQLGDKHLFFERTITPRVAQWPGFIVALRDGHWEIVDGDKSLVGARIESCDGEPIETYARARLGAFNANWDIEAQRIATASQLFVDYGNPFIKNASHCVIRRSSGTEQIELAWMVTLTSALSNKLDAPVGHPGFGLERAGKGWWIKLEELSNKASAVVSAARLQRQALRSAPFVVLDLRGNGGGNSHFGDELADILSSADGPAPASAEVTKDQPACPDAWRASPDNLASMEEILSTYSKNLGDEWTRGMNAQIEGVKSAIKRGASFAYDVAPCAGRARDAARSRTNAGKFATHVAVLTDHSCFSSCILVVKEFLSRGAVQVGEATDAMPNYFETRISRLPSGLGFLATLQKVSFQSEAQIGPYSPTHRFRGDISDDVAVRRWVNEIMGGLSP